MLPARGRVYKSRKSRPCDLCRVRKTACHMEHGPPCQLCAERQRQCTFLQAPGARKRPGTRHTLLGADSRPIRDEVASTSAPESRTREWPADVLSTSNMPIHHFELESPPYGETGLLREHSAIDGVPAILMHRSINYLDENLDFLPSEALETSRDVPHQPAGPNPTADVVLDSPQLTEAPMTTQTGRALDGTPNVSYRAIGPTGDLDLYVLSHRSYDENDESTVVYRGLRYRRMSTTNSSAGAPPPVFTVTNDEFAAQIQPRLRRDEIEQAKTNLAAMISPKLAYRLVLLYTHYVHPHFPIVSARQLPTSPDQIDTVPSSLLAAICATAIPFITYDDVLSIWLPESPSKDELFNLAWILLIDELHTPHLSTIQTCLLLLQSHTTSRYFPGTPFKPTLLNTTVALCHCLGLHRNSSRWLSMQLWERRLRKRIWWATWMMDKWICLGESVPSTLKDEECDVEPLIMDDFEDDLPDDMEPMQPVTHFLHLASLTTILDGVYNTFFSVRAAARTAANLELSLEAAKSLRTELKQWHDALPTQLKRQGVAAHGSNSERSTLGHANSLWNLDARGSFHLAYLTVQLTLFRALLRPVSIMKSLPSSPAQADGLDAGELNGPKAIIKGAIAVVEEVVALAESLGSTEWDAFWHSWSRTNFAIASCVMLHLLLILRPPLRPTQVREDSSNTVVDHSQPLSLQEEQDQEHINSFLNLQSDYRVLLDYLTRWRWAMKVASRGAGGRKGLMNLSLLRMDAFLAELCSPNLGSPEDYLF